MVFRCCLDVTDHQNEHEDEVEDQHANGATEAHHVASTNALAKEDAVVVITSHANVAVLAVIHIPGDVNVALDTIKDFVSSSILVFSNLISWLIVPSFTSLLSLGLSLLLPILVEVPSLCIASAFFI